ncbi:MAG: tetratricopeptide repeat protein [Methanotrichaceae archaeon]|nr:tetratricopeptide repeat protein [Methanotrichaceae archaeon]
MKCNIILVALILCGFTAAAIGAGDSADNTTTYWNDQGDLLMLQYEFEDALNAYNNSLMINGSNVPALIGQGRAFINLGLSNESLKSYESAISISPGNVKAWIGRGIVLQDLGRYNESLQSYNRALELDPADAYALNDKAWLYYKRGNYEEAITNVDRAIDIFNSGLAAALDTKAVALAALGRNEEALEYINQALEIDPQDSIIWIHKGNILKALGNTSGSEAAFAKVNELPVQNLNNESV